MIKGLNRSLSKHFKELLSVFLLSEGRALISDSVTQFAMSGSFLTLCTGGFSGLVSCS